MNHLCLTLIWTDSHFIPLTYKTCFVSMIAKFNV